MASLKVFLHGQFQSQIELNSNRELLAGRGESCDLVLNPERGISRQHFRVRFTEGHWVVEVLSRFGELYREGERQSIFTLENGVTFQVPPYEFVFESENSRGVASSFASGVSKRSAASFDEDRTHVGYIPSIAMLKLTDQRGQLVQTYQLEGRAWVGGRDTQCSIYIDNPRIGRKQFEVQKQDEVFFIRDLGSVNTTLLNGRPLPTEDWTPLGSGDVVSIGDWTLQFELRDAQFEKRLSEVDPSLMSPPPSEQPAWVNPNAFQNPSFDMSEDPAARMNVSSDPFHFTSQPPPPEPKGMKIMGRQVTWLNPVRLLILVALFGAVAYQQFGDNGPTPTVNAKAVPPFDKLSPEKQQMVKQFYATAQSLLAQNRYELARQEIIKLHQIIPYYEDSKTIEEVANQGLAVLQEREKAEKDERERQLMEEKIQRQVAECRKQMAPDSDSNWLEGCLAPVIQFDPTHLAIVALRQELEQRMAERAKEIADQKAYAARAARMQALYDNAKRAESEGKPLKAIAAYEKVVQARLPDPKGYAKIAKRQIASIQEDMLAKQLDAEQKAEAAYRSGQIKQAILILRDGMEINPDNEVLKGKHSQYMLDLRKQMMNFYQEGILEESVGELETAKTKWRKIQEQSLPGEDYYEKSRLKLKKYGAL